MTQLPSSERTRERLLTAASQEILESGFAGASLANIAARIGYTKGSLGYHFPTKETILDALMERLILADERAATRAAKAFPDNPSRALLAHIAAYSFLASVDAPTSAASLLSYDPSVPLNYGRESYLVWEDRLSRYLEDAAEIEGYQLTMSPKDGARRIMTATTGDHVTSQFQDIGGDRPRMAQLGPAIGSVGLRDIDAIETEVREEGFFFSLDPAE